MKQKKYFIQIAVGLAFSMFIMNSRGAFEAGTAADCIMAISDGFSVTGILFAGIGMLVWISSLTGFFDPLGYAAKRGLHIIIPAYILDPGKKFYDYKMEKAQKREQGGKSERSLLFVGLGFLAIGVLFVLIWYGIAQDA